MMGQRKPMPQPGGGGGQPAAPMPAPMRPAPMPMQPPGPAMQGPGMAMQGGPQFGPFRQHLEQGIRQLTPEERQIVRILLARPQIAAIVAKLLGPEFVDLIQRGVEVAQRSQSPAPPQAPQPAAPPGRPLPGAPAPPMMRRPAPAAPQGNSFDRMGLK